MTRRTDRIADLLRAEISDVLRRDIHDPRVRLAAATDVDVSPDLRHAIVYVSVLGADDERDTCLEALGHAAGFVRAQLAKRLRQLKKVPDLRFELDRGAELSDQMDAILGTLHEEDSGA